jgi:hypothetical protein
MEAKSGKCVERKGIGWLKRDVTEPHFMTP